MTEAKVLLYTGVALSFAGTVVAGFAGVQVLWTKLVRASRMAVGRILRRHQHVVVAAGTAVSRSSGQATARVQLPRGGTVEEQIVAIWRDLDTLREDTDQLGSELRSDLAGQGQRIGELEAQIERAASNLARQLDREKRAAADVDARGFALLAPGVVLTGLPAELASLPPLGWSFFGTAIAMFLAVAWSVFHGTGQ